MRFNRVKRTVMATALAVATMVAGIAGQAQAFTFGDGDLVLAIYGNSNEALVNLGNANTILAPGGAGILNLNVASELAAASVGTGTLQYTVFGHNFNNTVLAATAAAPATITGQLGLGTQFGNSVGMSFAPVFNSTSNLVPSGDGQSFTTNLNASGSSTMSGSWSVVMAGGIGSVLNVLLGDVATQTFTQVGRVQLTSNGLLTVGNPGPAAVPLPAAMVLFGTGLIGLVGIARRAMTRHGLA